MLARAAHDLVHDRFCIERMVREIESIYDEGAAEMAIRRGLRKPGRQVFESGAGLPFAPGPANGVPAGETSTRQDRSA